MACAMEADMPARWRASCVRALRIIARTCAGGRRRARALDTNTPARKQGCRAPPHTLLPSPRSYVTPGRVIIRDKRLGFLHLFLTMAILLYIGVYQLLYQQVYRKEVGGQAAGAGG